MKENEELPSGYCELCGGCGEDGCCSHINCFQSLIKNPKCKYGETYLREASLCKEVSEMYSDLVWKLETNLSYTRTQFIIDCNVQYSAIWDKIMADEHGAVQGVDVLK